MAQTMKVPGDQLRWYAAFHNESPPLRFHGLLQRRWNARYLRKETTTCLFPSFIRIAPPLDVSEQHRQSPGHDQDQP